jgi:translation initiation factor IF-2
VKYIDETGKIRTTQTKLEKESAKKEAEGEKKPKVTKDSEVNTKKENENDNKIDTVEESESDDMHGLLLVGDIHGSLNSLRSVLEIVDKVI